MPYLFQNYSPDQTLALLYQAQLYAQASLCGAEVTCCPGHKWGRQMRKGLCLPSCQVGCLTEMPDEHALRPNNYLGSQTKPLTYALAPSYLIGSQVKPMSLSLCRQPHLKQSVLNFCYGTSFCFSFGILMRSCVLHRPRQLGMYTRQLILSIKLTVEVSPLILSSSSL